MSEALAVRDPELVEKFLENVRGTIPIAIEEIEVILRLVAAAGLGVKSYLDLSCAGGVVAAAILDEYPGATAIVLGTSALQLEAVRLQLGPRDDRASLHLATIRDPQWTRQASALEPYDLITSGIEIRHLPEARQQTFFREVYDLLQPGGFFLLLDHVASATRWTQSKWDDQIIETIFGEELEKDRSKPRSEIAWDFYQSLLNSSQKIAPLEVLCDWLREIGFESVECYLKVAELAVFGGQKPLPASSPDAASAIDASVFVTG